MGELCAHRKLRGKIELGSAPQVSKERNFGGTRIWVVVFRVDLELLATAMDNSHPQSQVQNLASKKQGPSKSKCNGYSFGFGDLLKCDFI